jgi:hypothetical protein
LPFFEYGQNPLKLSELSEPIDIPSMQQGDSRSFSLVMVGDPDSVEGRESVHHVSRVKKNTGKREASVSQFASLAVFVKYLWSTFLAGQDVFGRSR